MMDFNDAVSQELMKSIPARMIENLKSELEQIQSQKDTRALSEYLQQARDSLDDDPSAPGRAQIFSLLSAAANDRISQLGGNLTDDFGSAVARSANGDASSIEMQALGMREELQRVINDSTSTVAVADAKRQMAYMDRVEALHRASSQDPDLDRDAFFEAYDKDHAEEK